MCNEAEFEKKNYVAAEIGPFRKKKELDRRVKRLLQLYAMISFYKIKCAIDDDSDASSIRKIFLRFRHRTA